MDNKQGDSRFRNKITWFTFAFSLLVVWVHSYNAELFLGGLPGMARIDRIEHWLGDGIGQIAVPGFFMISAYLFYRNFAWEKLWAKWNSRIRSILVPFVLWNFLFYLGYVTGSRLPWLGEVMGKGVIPFRFDAMIDAILHYTYNYVFWYLYQLLILIALAPVLYLCLKNYYAGIVFQLVLWAFLLSGGWLPILNLDALIYYSFAAFLGLHGKKTVEGRWSPRQAAVGLAAVGLGMVYYYLGLRLAYLPLLVLCRILAVTGLWLMVPKQRLPRPRVWMNYNFFLYATHFAFVRLINKVGARLGCTLPVFPLVLYLLMPVLVLVISYWLGSFLRRFLPRTWRLLNGGR